MAAPAAKSKGTQSTEAITGSAAIKLMAALNGINAAKGDLDGFANKVQENTLKIEDQEAKLANLATELKNKQAQNGIELQQSYDANKEMFVSKYANEKNLTVVPTTQWNQVNSDLTAAKTDVQTQINAAVGAATGQMKRANEAEIKLKEAEYKASAAENVAKINQQTDQITFLNTQIASWKGALDKEVEAGVKRAQAGQIQNLNVGSDNGRK